MRMKCLLLLLLLTGCSSEEYNSHPYTEELYFMGGQISCMCMMMKDRPDMFKPEKIKEFKITCEQYKDFQTFRNNLDNDTIKRVGEMSK